MAFLVLSVMISSSLKPTETVRPLLRKVELCPPYKGAKDYFYTADVDDHDNFLSWLLKLANLSQNLSPEENSYSQQTMGEAFLANSNSDEGRWQ